MKKLFLILIGVIIIFGLTACGNKKTNNDDSLKFKEEYESLNGTLNSQNSERRTVLIDEDNPFVYSSSKEIVEKIKDKKTFYVYFGSSYCPWCRSVIEKLVEMANKNKIDTIYYVDIWDGDHVENFRDVYQVSDDGSVKLKTNGTKEYYQLLDYFDNVLSDYTLTGKDGNSKLVGEKRIMVPSFIYVEKGKTIKLETGISSKQENSSQELSNEILDDEENKFNEFFSK